jgi:anti-anti-sigma factor
MPARLAHPAARANLVFPIAGELLREHSIPRALIGQALESGADALHLDLGAVEAPTAAGLGTLVRVHRELRNAGVNLVLLNVCSEMYRVFEVTGLTRLFTLGPVPSPESPGSRN